MGKVLAVFWIFFLTVCFAEAKTYFVSVSGNDTNNGLTVGAPFKTITKAISLINPGDTVYVRGGVHAYSSSITISKSGTVADTCFLFAYPGERPVLDFSGTSFGTRGVKLSGSYWYIKGFDIIKAGDNGMNISTGGNNVIEFCSFIENKDSGLQLNGGTHDNKIINCDSYYNADPTDYGDADGFASKMDVGGNNSFYGCRAWLNVDDGWDGYLRGADNVSTILENCWTWRNGYFKDGTDGGASANGNGFKMGGSDDKLLKHDFTLKNCIAFDNKAKGFDQNSNKGSMIMHNCSAYRNKSNNYSASTALSAGKILELKNCLTADGKVSLGSFAVLATNSWMAPFSVTSADFVSLDTTGVAGPRKPDGSLPDVPFLHLAAGSSLINAGTNIGLPFIGLAPDLGAFEYGLTDISVSFFNGNGFKAFFKGGNLILKLNSPAGETLRFCLYRINGQLSFSSEIKESGQVQSFDCTRLPQGIYILELESGLQHWQPQKLVKMN